MSTQSTEHVVYRFFDANDNLLYVGSTRHWATRLDTHRRSAEWYPEVARHEVTAYATMEEAREQERTLIATAAPWYNVSAGGAGRHTTPPATPS